MRSITGFIVSPDGERYNNKINVGDKELIVNSEIQNHEYVNRALLRKPKPERKPTHFDRIECVSE